MKYVIIGNSAAAVGAVEGIRKIDSEGQITLISSEKYHTYARPLISYYIQGKINDSTIKYRGDSFYSDNNCDLLSGKTAVSIDPENKTVLLNDNTKINYDKLLTATGSTPFIPPFKGLETVKDYHTFYTFDDAKKQNSAVNENSRVLIIGAGLIGLKCAECLSGKAKKISVVDMSKKILSSILDGEASEFLKAVFENNKIELILGQGVNYFEKNIAILENNDKIEFDILVIAVGVKPQTALLKDCGAEVNKGIVIDEYMKTSINDIYAAGDCTESYDISSDEKKVLALLPNAYFQGECAGFNMAGESKTFTQAVPMNAIGFFGTHIITAGSYCGELYKNKTDKTLKKLFYKDNLLKGFILINDVDKAGIYTSLIRDKTPLDSLDFQLICENPSLAAFSSKDRSKMLRGEK